MRAGAIAKAGARLRRLATMAPAAVLVHGLAGMLLLGACEQNEAARSSAPAAAGRAVVARGTQRPEQLVFGLTPFLPDATLKREFRPLMEHIAQEVGVPVKIALADDYAALSQMLARGRVHMAVLSPFNYVRAKRDNPGLVLLATQIANGASTYSAYIVTRKDSGIDAVTDLRGKRFGFVDKQSTSGYLYPMAHLLRHDIQPTGFFAQTRFLGNHARLLQAVLKGRVDAGATFSTAYQMLESQRPGAERLQIVAKTGRIPYDAYCASPRLSPQLIASVRRTLLDLSTRSEAGRAVLQGLTHINGFVAVDDAHYDDVREVAELVMPDKYAAP